MPLELNARSRKILYAVVTEFIASGEPVGSRTLSKKYEIDLSPASIRNVLADLEDAGYFHQPHASAGRIPTDKAFRVFIDALMELREISVEQRAAIEHRFEAFDALAPGTNVMRETARLLSGLTGTAAVVVSPRLETQQLKQLRFIATRPGELLCVIVTASGNVENRFIAVDAAPNNDELQRIHNLLDDVLEGRTLQEIRELFARRLQETRSELGALRHRAFALGQAALAGRIGRDLEQQVVIEGQAQLFEHPEFADVDRLKQLMRVLDEREQLVKILDRTLETRGVRVVLPGEESSPSLGVESLSVVSAPFAVEGEGRGASAGSVGVIGPTRMDYAAIVPLVNETARRMGAFLSRDRRHDDDDDE